MLQARGTGAQLQKPWLAPAGPHNLPVVWRQSGRLRANIIPEDSKSWCSWMSKVPLGSRIHNLSLWENLWGCEGSKGFGGLHDGTRWIGDKQDAQQFPWCLIMIIAGSSWPMQDFKAYLERQGQGFWAGGPHQERSWEHGNMCPQIYHAHHEALQQVDLGWFSKRNANVSKFALVVIQRQQLPVPNLIMHPTCQESCKDCQCCHNLDGWGSISSRHEALCADHSQTLRIALLGKPNPWLT